VLGYLHQSQPLLQSDYDHHAVLRGVIFSLVQVDASDPQARYRLEVGLGAELGQRVDGEGVVAEDACLVDLGEDEDLLDAGAVVVAVRRLEPRGDDGRRLLRGITGFWGEQDEVEDLGGGGADIEVAVWG
jgi:hypothetical protein